MPNTIPPLVCNTPPPIDDLDSDEDLSAPNESNYDHFVGMFDHKLSLSLILSPLTIFHKNLITFFI